MRPWFVRGSFRRLKFAGRGTCPGYQERISDEGRRGSTAGIPAPNVHAIIFPMRRSSEPSIGKVTGQSFRGRRDSAESPHGRSRPPSSFWITGAFKTVSSTKAGSWPRFRPGLSTKLRTLADHLEARGDLPAARRASLLEALVRAHLNAHGGDVEKSLAAVSADPLTKASLPGIGRAEINATLTQFENTDGSTMDGDPDRTFSYAVGSATTEGQRFRVLRPHAKGGLGAVFVALDSELNREVALKQILDHHADDPTSRTRFVLEAEITGGLEHPGIVPVYGLGRYSDGRLIMRCASSAEIASRMRSPPSTPTPPSGPTRGQRSLALRTLLRRFVDVCNAIDYAHTRGVIHRDIKPANVILGKHGETLVVDWGLAKPLGASDPGAASEERALLPSSSSGSAETLPGSALGTPAYMSPEQARGELDRLSPRSDVYSLGATLYCVLTGQPPAVSDDIGEVLRAAQRAEFPLPRRIDSSIDRPLEAICLKAMALDPHDRYESSQALADDVDAGPRESRSRHGANHQPFACGTLGPPPPDAGHGSPGRHGRRGRRPGCSRFSERSGRPAPGCQKPRPDHRQRRN